MNELTIGHCQIQYDGPDEFGIRSPDLSRALEAIFTPGESFGVGGGEVALRCWHSLGADEEVTLAVMQGQHDLFAIRLPDLYAVDALRRYCDMILEHNRQLEARHGPRPD
jgi:hypothetical protein